MINDDDSNNDTLLSISSPPREHYSERISFYQKRLGFIWAIRFNFIISSLGMFSLGLLAALITIDSEEASEDEIQTGTYIMAILSFITAIAGKAAIVLYFNVPSLKKLLVTIYEEGWVKAFAPQFDSVFSVPSWGINRVLSLFASLFWTGLVQVSFKQSANLAKRPAIGNWYVYIWFSACSFYANWRSWPTVFKNAFKQKKEIIKWLLESPEYRQQKDNAFNKLENNARTLLWELKGILNKGGDTRPLLLPTTDNFIRKLGISRNAETLDGKFSLILSSFDNLSSPELRQALLKIDSTEPTVISTNEWSFYHFLALGFTVTSIVGFSNIPELSDTVWRDWGSEEVSTYFARYVAYYGTSEMLFQTAYPMVYTLMHTFRLGREPYVFSNFKLGIILFAVLFVGIFAGFSNGEQSKLAHQNGFLIAFSILGSFLLDSPAIFYIGRDHYESNIETNEQTDFTITCKKQFLSVQKAIRKVLRKEKLSLSEWDELITDNGEERTHNRYRFWQGAFTRCFSSEKDQSASNPTVNFY